MNFDFKNEPGKILKGKYTSNDGHINVSIITAYFNASKYILQTAYSILNQTFPYFEWIIVNDGSSSENELKKLKEIAGLDNRIRVLHQENKGAAAARMKGILDAKSDIIVILDADDLMDERFIEYTYFALIQNPSAMWAFTDSVGFYKNEYIWDPIFSSEKMKEMNILVYCAAIRKTVFLDDNLYDISNRNEWEDYQFWLKMLAKRYVPVHVKQKLFWYRRLDTGELSKIDKDEKLKKSLSEKIKILANEVPEGIRAIEPFQEPIGEFEKPYLWDWNLSLPVENEIIRILFIFPHMECGGADKFNLDIVNNLDKRKFSCSIITTINAESEWRREFTRAVDDVFELPSFLNIKDWPAFIHYFIKTRKIDIVCNISSYYSYYLFPWLRIQFPEVALIDCVHADAPYWREGGYTRTSANMGDATEMTYVTNEYTRDLLVSKYGKEIEKTKVIHTGVDEKVFLPDRISEENVREKYNINKDNFTVLFLCRMAPEKRPFLLLEIAKKVKKIDPSIQFLMVGGGPQLEEIRGFVQQYDLNNVIITGSQEDIKPFYKISDLFVLCSIMEGLSVTTIEAMLMEIPVISADVGSQFELVDDTTGCLIKCRQNGKNEFDSRIFCQEEIEEYVTAIIKMSKEKEKYSIIKENCRKKVLNGFTLNNLIETLETDFVELFSPKSKANRNKIFSLFNCEKHLAEDYLTMYVAYERIAMVADKIWNSCQYEIRLKEQYKRRLDEIYGMKMWKLILRYQKSFLFRIIKKIKKS